MNIKGSAAVVSDGASGPGKATVRELHARSVCVLTASAHHLVKNRILNGESIGLDGAPRMPPR